MNAMQKIDRRGSAVVSTPAPTDILIARHFDAPAALIFKAVTTPDLVKRWWGFGEARWLVCDIDLRVGGKWRYLTETAGRETGFHGEYREIERPHRLVSTEMFEGIPGATDADAAVNTITLTERDGVTTLQVLVRHTRPEHRDMHLGAGMERGMQVSYDRLETLVHTLAAAR